MSEVSLLQAAASPRPGLLQRLRADRFLKNNAIYLAGSVGVGAFGYVFHFATGRLLGPASYAIVAAMVSGLSLLSLPSLVLQTVAARFVSLLSAHAEAGAIRKLLLRLTGICLVGIVLVGGALALAAPALAAYFHLPDRRFVYLLIVASALALLVAIMRGAFQGMTRFLMLSLNTLLDMMTRVVVGVGLILAGLGAIGAAIGIAAGPLVAYAQGAFVFRRLSRSATASVPTLADVGRYSVWAIVAGAGITYLLSVDVLLAKHFLPGDQSGLYAAGAVLGRVIYFLGTTVAAVMFPEVTLRHARGELHYLVVEKSLLLLGVLSGVFVVAYAVLPSVVIAPFGASFSPTAPYLVWFAIALSFFAFAVLFINYFLSINSRRFVVPLVAACVLETALISVFHHSPFEVVSMVLVSMAVLLASLSLLYAGERFGVLQGAAR